MERTGTSRSCPRSWGGLPAELRQQSASSTLASIALHLIGPRRSTGGFRAACGARPGKAHKSKRLVSTAAHPSVSTDFGEPARFGPAYACFQSEVGDAGDGIEEADRRTWRGPGVRRIG